MRKYGVTHRLSTAYHPQTSGPVEEKTKRIHDFKIKNRVFNVGDQVLLFNLRLKIFSSKLKSHWSGAFTIPKVFPYGTVELSQANGPNFKVNGHRIKHYFGGNVPQLEVNRHEVLGYIGDKLVCWPSKKQNYVSISTAESEYVAVSSCCAQVLWMRTQLTDYGFFYDKVPIYCDSKSAIAISCNLVQHTRTKHINVRYQFIKDHVEKGTIELYFVGTEYLLADLFTKSPPEARFKFLVKKLGMMSRET
nr:retrovirus-related Pol polyprotein from transposon TNT 1-94 [Tanacetum cinerariifolium]